MKSKILCISLLVLFCIAPLIVTADSGDTGYTFENGETIITIAGDDLPVNKAELIFKDFTGKAEIRMTPYGIFCLFGHDIVEGVLTEIAHNVYSTSPKCHFTAYDLKYCARSSCDYYATNATDSFRAGCH